MRFVCLWQWLGKGFHALQGVDVKWCPRAGHGALSVGPALDWARSSRGLGSLLGTPLGASRPSPLAQLPRAFLGGSQWAHLPHIGCDPCLALCPLGPFPLLGARPLTPQREDPVRGSCGQGAGADSVCGEQVTGTGAWAWEGGEGALVVFLLGSMFEDAGKLHVVEVAFLINGCLAVHLVHFLICEAVAHGGEQLPEMVLMDET